MPSSLSLRAAVFQSTPSARRATKPGASNDVHMDISIHALREEGDPRILPRSQTVKYFNPRPPRGGRQQSSQRGNQGWKFQSTPSARRATNIVCAVGGGLLHFNPRPPWGKRPDKPKTPAPAKQFQSAISTWKATTDKLIVYDEAYMISIHALREEGDRRLHR